MVSFSDKIIFRYLLPRDAEVSQCNEDTKGRYFLTQ